MKPNLRSVPSRAPAAKPASDENEVRQLASRCAALIAELSSISEALYRLNDARPREQETPAIAPTALLRPAEAAEWLQVARVTLWRLSRSGALPKPIKIGRRAIAWRASDLHAWLAKQAA